MCQWPAETGPSLWVIPHPYIPSFVTSHPYIASCVTPHPLYPQLCGSGLLRPVRPLVTDQKLHLLWPQPQRLQQLEGPAFCPSDTVTVALARSCGAELHR